MIIRYKIRKKIKGKKKIGSGARRLVYDLGNGTVIKIAKPKGGIRSNKKEFVVYKSSTYKIKKHLGKIKKHGRRYDWLIMKKYSKKFPKSKKYKRKLYKLKKLFKKNGVIPYEIMRRRTGKPNFQNLRLNKKGKIIVIDYGNFKFIRNNRLSS
ncbi:hypothetical protein [Paenibacillus naphthalenovorans]|uniref:Uncharacterized protein n=1 Tax=Paenibacillus naphthalenovorans TaxID=162209 RepID=A0A0U2VMS8_9BACL|nr:hypothetical protein [Paenibacillus naphthalenovorans]ALS20823.1 hypothetical protein IJ22_04340 [Paenibacillus naphthalenovorans]GCL70853.1 hypothetical protein PN4B1_07550 [Paenibacillus naphthalenovorans]SDI20964.1 hypothetical protein SAMN05421868_10476 [Paenibacillus naphthalenovorans]